MHSFDVGLNFASCQFFKAHEFHKRLQNNNNDNNNNNVYDKRKKTTGTLNSHKFLQSSSIYVDSCEDSYEDEDCSCDSSSSYDVLHSRYVRRWQESAET